MKLHDLHPPKGAKKDKKRKGRGIAAGQGKTAGYGTKGQNARSGRGGKPYFEGGQLPLVRRLPLKRGFSNINRIEYRIVNVRDLNRFETDSVVGCQELAAAGLIRDNEQPLKILGDGDLEVALTVKADAFSSSAERKIEAAGGIAERA